MSNMQGGNIVHVYDAENIKLINSKSKSVEVGKSRRPLSDINNILPIKSEKSKKKQEKEDKKNVADLIINKDDSVKSNNSILQSDGSYDNLEKVLDPTKRENELELKERLYDLTDYVDDVYDYLRNLEVTNLIGAKHLNGLEMTEKMRAILVDWMIEVHSHFCLTQETLELSIFILDRYTEIKRNLTKRNAQLIGLVSIFLAAKYEETEPLEICDIVFVSDSSVSKKEILRAEKIIFRTIEYNLSTPLPIHFVRRYSKIAGVTPIEHAYAIFFCDTALLEYSLVSIRPSLLAAAALFLGLCVSKDVIDVKIWNDKLIQHSKYHLKDFHHILPRIATAVQLCLDSKLEAVKKKHSSAERYYVSMMPGVQPAIKGTVLEHFNQ